MDYKFVQTIHGPAIFGDDEVVYFNQHQLMLDYYDSDPEFLLKAKEFIADGIRNLSGDLAESITSPLVVGGDLAQPLYGFINSIHAIRQFEYNFLPSVFPNLRN